MEPFDCVQTNKLLFIYKCSLQTIHLQIIFKTEFDIK